VKGRVRRGTGKEREAGKYGHMVRGGHAMDYLKYHLGLTCPTPLRPAGSHPRNSLKTVSGEAARKASGLQLSYYPFGYPMMYASKEEEKERVRRGRGKEREEGKAWAYGEGWPWTP
jgi:hypothetical protein